MKKIKKFLSVSVITLTMVFSMINVNAASFTVKTSKSSPKIGESFKVTVSASGYVGKFSFSCSGNLKINKTSEWLENSSTTITVTALGEGPGTVTATSVDAATTGTDPQPVSLNKTVSVNVVNSSSQNEGTTDNKSGVNTLKALSVSEGTLSPEFSSKTTSYKVSVPAATESITIKATATDAKASISGTGKKNLKVGSNKFTIACTAENGARKYYVVTIDVDETPSLYTEFNGKKLGFVTNLNDVKAPEGYTKSTTQFDGNEVSCFVNETTGLTLCYLVDEQGNKAFYIYADGKVTGTYQTITIDNKIFVIIDIPSDQQTKEGMTFTTLTIQEQELSGWKYDDQNLSDYQLLYLMNVQTGEKNFYLYEVTEGTIQKQPSESSETAIQEQTPSHTLTYVFLGTTVLFVLVSIGLFVYLQNFKKKSISAIKAYYERKSRD